MIRRFSLLPLAVGLAIMVSGFAFWQQGTEPTVVAGLGEGATIAAGNATEAVPKPDALQVSEAVRGAESVPLLPKPSGRSYLDELYGFEIQHPEDWAAEVARIEDPEGTNPTKRVVGFGPQERRYQAGPGALSPLSIELSVGTLEQYRGIYPESQMEKSRGAVINGYQVSVEESKYGDVLYIFENPADANVRATLRDYTSMIGDLEGEERDELRSIIGRMISTFKFAQ